MADPIKVTDWSLRFCQRDFFRPPEGSPMVLCGVWPDGVRRRSSAIKEYTGPRTLRTANTLYEVEGAPESGYAEHCRETGKPLADDNPLGFAEVARG